MSGEHLERVKCDGHTCNLMLGLLVLTSGQSPRATLKVERSMISRLGRLKCERVARAHLSPRRGDGVRPGIRNIGEPKPPDILSIFNEVLECEFASAILIDWVDLFFAFCLNY